jgi:predicted nucleic acid-binding protein
VRGLLGGPRHPIWAYLDGSTAPELLLVETANALTLYVRAGRMTPSQAARALSDVLALRLRLEPLEALVAPALEAALRHGISAYDACYLALAEQTGALLVTADRRLAGVAGRSELVD